MSNKIVLSITILLLLVTGCSDNFLQTEPIDRLSTANFWKTEEDARLAVNALYNFLQTDIFVRDAISDIATTNTPSSGSAQNAQGLRTSTSGWGDNQWYDRYKGIRAANEFLTNVDKVQTDNRELIERYKAEARFIRAYEYMYLVMFYGDVPLILETITIEEAKNLTRTPKEEIWNFVGTEFQEILAVLPVSYDQDVGRITKGAALAFKARAMLHAGRYTKAAEAAKAVMDLNVYSIYPSYEDLFSYEGEHNSGVILNKEFMRDVKSNRLFHILAPNSQADSDSRFVPTKKLVDAYEMQTTGMAIGETGSGYDPNNPYQNRDPRLHYSIFVYGDTLPNGQIYDPRPGFGGSDDITRSFKTTGTGFNIKKYVNTVDLDQPENCGINIILMRYAEVLLIYAEAKIEMGEIDQSVYDAINEVRQREDVMMPIITDSGQSQDQMRQIVRHERMVELAFEGQRYFDIRRWGIAEEVMNGPIKGITSTQNIFADRSGWAVIDFSSDNPSRGNVAANAIDGDATTIWHTEWVGSPDPPHPHYITIDMGASIEIIGFSLTGRLGYDEGNPEKIVIEVSNDGTNWVGAETFTLKNVDANTVYPTSPWQGRYVRLTVNSSFGGTTHTHMAEIEAIIKQNVETWEYAEYQRDFTAPRDYLLPIPQKELELNNQLTQNTGY